jgi:hypothetical protein
MKKTQYSILLILISFTSIYCQTTLYNTKKIKLKQEYKDISGLGKYRYDSISYTEAKNQ